MGSRQFIRFGEIPPNENSAIYRNGETIIGYELGTSVYDCTIIDGEYRIVLPRILTEQVLWSLQGFCYYNEINIYLVEGDVVGQGSDGEPVIKNVKIIKNITNEICSTKSK